MDIWYHPGCSDFFPAFRTHKELVTVLLVCAKADINLQSASPLDAEDDTEEHSRLVMLECRIHNDNGSLEARIDKMGEWYFDGPVSGVGVRRESDSEYFTNHRLHYLTL